MAHIPLPFDLSLVGKAADALRKHQKIKNKKTKASSLFGEEPFYLHLMVTFEKIPPKPSPYPQILTTPHSIHENIDVDVCFLAKKYSKPTKETFVKTNLPIKKVRSLKKLAYKNNTVELQKKFAAGFDIFMVDADEAENVPRFAGKFFQKKGKVPLPVVLDHTKPQEFKVNFEKARDSAHFMFSNGNTICFKIANSSMENDKIKENVISALEDLAKKHYKKKLWSAFRTISLKSTNSIALPLFERLPTIVSKYDESALTKRPRSEIESKSSSDEVVDSTNKDLAVLNPKKKGAIFAADSKAESDDEFDDYGDYASESDEDDDDEEEDDDDEDDDDEEDDEEEEEESEEEEVPAPVVQTPSNGKKATPGKVVVTAAATPQKKAQTQPKRPATPAPAAFKTPQPAKAAPSTPSKVTGSQSASRPTGAKKVAAAAPSTPSRKPVRK